MYEVLVSVKSGSKFMDRHRDLDIVELGRTEGSELIIGESLKLDLKDLSKKYKSGWGENLEGLA